MFCDCQALELLKSMMSFCGRFSSIHTQLNVLARLSLEQTKDFIKHALDYRANCPKNGEPSIVVYRAYTCQRLQQIESGVLISFQRLPGSAKGGIIRVYNNTAPILQRTLESQPVDIIPGELLPPRQTFSFGRWICQAANILDLIFGFETTSHVTLSVECNLLQRLTKQHHHAIARLRFNQQALNKTVILVSRQVAVNYALAAKRIGGGGTIYLPACELVRQIEEQEHKIQIFEWRLEPRFLRRALSQPDMAFLERDGEQIVPVFGRGV